MINHKVTSDAKKLVKEILQSGFDVGMLGDVFNTEQENKELQQREYEMYVKIYTDKIIKLSVNFWEKDNALFPDEFDACEVDIY